MMKMRKYLLSIVFLGHMLSSTVVYSEDVTLNILYTGSLQGQLETCGCSPISDFGGMARLAGFIKANSDALSPYILIDAGNFASDDTRQGCMKTETLIKSLTHMKYDLIAMQDREGKLPAEYINPLMEESGLKFLGPDNRVTNLRRGNIDINLSTDIELSRIGAVNILLTGAAVGDIAALPDWQVVISAAGEELETPVRRDANITTAGFPKGKRLGILSLIINENKVLGYTHFWQPLGSDMQEDPDVRAILTSYDKKVAELYRDAYQFEPGSTYVGVKKCAECHQIFFESWEDTRHAGAFASLQKVQKDENPECVACHVTGFGEKGGFYSVETTPGLKDIQCEACHGYNIEHLDDDTEPMNKVTEKVCLKCHTRENSPAFDYTEYSEKIKHW